MIVYDINAMPVINGKMVDGIMLLKISEMHNIIFYDSTRGNAPKVVDAKDAEKFGVIDTSTPEGKAKFQELIEKL